jgi:cytidine deaminase
VKESLSTVKLGRRTALTALGAAGAGLLSERLMSMDANPSSAGAQDAVLDMFNEKSRHRLHGLLTVPGFSGQIPSSDVELLAGSEGKPAPALMTGLLPLAQTYARPPISNYRVGAVARGASGALYLGANLEFSGQALGFSVHAEQSALSNAYMHDEGGVPAIAVTAAPCGHCRQFMMELSPEGGIEVIVSGKSPAKLSTLLPMAFGPKDLGLGYGALPVKEVDLAVSAASDEVVAAALAAARRSWAPYSKAPSGVALQTKAGRVHKGSYIENAAFNPSLPPFEAALAAVIVAGEDGANISRAVLVEVEGASISQQRVAEAALSAIAPALRLQVVAAQRRG